MNSSTAFQPTAPTPRRAEASRRFAALALAMALAPMLGCGREFFREWANQDVSEAVFEKSRDPHFRLDLFTVDPPAMARYADPYDPDRPPAPPDDPVAAALSPVPQSPENRLLVPLEGTGYLVMLDQFQASHPPDVVKPRTVIHSMLTPDEPETSPPPPVPPESARSPFAPEAADAPRLNAPPVRTPIPGAPAGISGTAPREISPLLGPGATPGLPEAPAANPSPPRAPAPTPAAPPAPTPAGPQARRSPARAEDAGVRRTALQDPAAPRPIVQPPASEDPSTDPLQTPRIPGDPGPREVQNLAKPILPRPDLTPDENQAAEGAASELSGLLGTGEIDFVLAEAVGLPRDFRPYVVNMGQAFTLALINSRVYQFQLENVYATALPVTLQRFAFTPQFIAGLSPTTGTVGPGATGGLFPSPSPGNSFLYRTKETGLQTSTLNLGTVAAVGKNFDNGVKILASFASQIVFNFTGKTPRQPTVNSFLPLTVVVPFLRGGGRAVTLEALTQAERNLVYAVRSFAKFRQEFVVTTLVGGGFANFGSGVATPGFSGGGNSDPTIGFLNVVEDIQLVENQTRNVATFEQFSRVYRELIRGESSGLTQLQLDQLDAQLQSARTNLIQTRNALRNDLDQFKFQLGLPPDTPMVVDRRATASFRAVYEEIERWSRNPKRELAQLDQIASRLPQLEDVVIDGRSCVTVFRSGTDDFLEDLLLASERVSLENRLDLMNSRAQLYDTWRQIKIAANALKGVLNVQLTNQILTPPTTTNPFAFVDQAKQFSLTINSELPLVRLAERNSFRTSLINYQRARRTLQSQEDFQKYQLRNDVRNLQQNYLNYQIAKRNFVLQARQKDQAFENIVAPPQGAAGAGGNASGAVQTNNLISAQSSLIQVENQLITTWYQYQTSRLVLYRDLGTLPFDEWEAFYELFPSEYGGNGAGADNAGGGPSGGPEALAPTAGGGPR